jgi:excisionase family DNA binding protein
LKQPLLYSVRQACAELGGISRNTFYRLVAARELRLVKIGTRSYVTADELHAYVSRLASTDS